MRWTAVHGLQDQPGRRRCILLGMVVLLAVLTVVPTSPSRAERALPGVQVLLEPSGDSELDRALQTDLNRELLEGVDSAELLLMAGERSETLAAELQRLSSLVRAFGYLDGAVDHQEREAIDPHQAPVLRLTPRTGSLYRLGSIQVIGLYQEGGAVLAANLHDHISRSVGEVARAETVSTIVREVLFRIRSASFPFVRLTDSRLLPDAATLTATLQLVVTPGVNAALGPVTFSGMQSIRQQDLEALVPFRRGEPYTPERISDLRRTLAEVPQIRTVRIETGGQPTAHGEVAVSVSVQEYADLRLLERFKPMGVAVLALTLLLLVIRQAMAVSAAPSRIQQGLTVATLLGIGLSALLVAERAAAFLKLV